MKIKIKIDSKNIEAIDDGLSRHIKFLDDFYYVCTALRRNGVEERKVASYYGMSVAEYRRAMSQNRITSQFLKSILEEIYK